VNASGLRRNLHSGASAGRADADAATQAMRCHRRGAATQQCRPPPPRRAAARAHGFVVARTCNPACSSLAPCPEPGACGRVIYFCARPWINRQTRGQQGSGISIAIENLISITIPILFTTDPESTLNRQRVHLQPEADSVDRFRPATKPATCNQPVIDSLHSTTRPQGSRA
jgi:hypothetical protein